MTATERLRQLLDERGVEWMGTSYTKPTQGHPTNTSLDEEHHNVVFIEYVDGSVLRLFDLTPEQAVAATLGRGTCRIDYHFGEWYCTGCGEMVGTSDPTSELCIDGNAIELWSFCPRCGRKVEHEQ